jgi:hypothetical protein
MGTRCRALQCSALRFGKLPLKAFPYTQRGRETEEVRGREKEMKPNYCKLRVIGERERKVSNIRGTQRERSERHGGKERDREKQPR